ncbi:MAG: glycosyltransferase [Armatimonadetes bacterium]|nr:glycosyltransferase [Armatimonadota bacterium]
MHVIEAMTGGSRRFVLDAIAKLPRDRFHQHVVLSLRRDPYGYSDVELIAAHGADVTVLDMVRPISIFHDLKALIALRRVINQWAPHIVHGHSSKGGFLARAGVKLCRLPHPPKVIYSPHCFAFMARTDPLRRFLYLCLERLASRWTTHFGFVSTGELAAAESARLRCSQRCTIFPLGVNVECFPQASAQLRREKGLPDGVIIISVGDLRPQKNPGMLLRAFAPLAHSRRNTYLLLVGEGPLRRQLERLAQRLGISQQVLFLGRRDDVPELLSAADVFVLCSLWEGMPYSLIEAMAAGLPVAVPDLQGVSDLVGEVGCGLVFQTGSVSAAAAAIKALSEVEAEQRQVYGAAGRKYVAAHRTLDHFASALEDLYVALAGQHR